MTTWDELFRPLEQMEFVPAANIVKQDDQFKVVLAVPGYTQEQLSLSVDGNVLEIRGQGMDHKANEEGVYLRREFRQVPFHYRVELPDRAQADHIAAELNQGLLTIQIPLPEKKVIPVRIINRDTASSIEA
ncbi:MAG: Hsp20/alpha crystallin family protein [Firmicutes bacterium]|jgi:HSP20 family molecular chaperone IbpA|uniref:Hsp20/alpha crystallin family protein n=1 Tax=Sulfobacillus benefaciens TaxID=453960 RepID=A0A2T2WYV6_9FIRM|nr:Hsp20/alpha crystallin family protein [Bacillota bacterium]PSR27430.1 MAG: Hsp20/alpha crystallin family protein [Sulfobacillus benefaciens]HBQ94326.1 Hsp20/alpha crystallin family protein [Sulfobacillus sp.]